jgi:hypothetical protein
MGTVLVVVVEFFAQGNFQRKLRSFYVFFSGFGGSVSSYGPKLLGGFKHEFYSP